MKILSKAVCAFLLVSNIALMPPSKAMELEANENTINANNEKFTYQSLMKKETLATLENIIKMDIVPDICPKMFILKQYFTKTDFTFNQDVYLFFAKFYYDMLLNEKYQNLQFVNNNPSLGNALQNHKKSLIIDVHTCIAGDPLSILSPNNNINFKDIFINELFILNSGCSPSTEILNFLNLVLKNCPIKTIKTDISFFNLNPIMNYFSQYYGGKLSKRYVYSESDAETQVDAEETPPDQIKADLHLYLDIDKIEFPKPGYNDERCTTIMSMSEKNPWRQKSTEFKFEFALEKCGLFNIVCIDTKNPFNRIIYSSKAATPVVTNEESGLMDRLHAAYNSLSSLSDWF